MLIRYGYEITLTCQQPTALVCLLSVHEDRAADIRARGDILHHARRPDIDLSRSLRQPMPATGRAGGRPDDLGRRHDRRRWQAGPGISRRTGNCRCRNCRTNTLVYLLGSRYCETDRLSQIAWDMFGTVAPGWGRVQAVCDFVHNHIRFDYMQARATRSAFETFHERIGVCRDFAHLAVAFCRCLNIPARYVNGHLGDIGVPVADPMDFSAWIEVFLDGAWHTFDPRNNVPRIGRIVVSVAATPPTYR